MRVSKKTLDGGWYNNKPEQSIEKTHGDAARRNAWIRYNSTKQKSKEKWPNNFHFTFGAPHFK